MYFLVLHTHWTQYLLRLIMKGGQCIIFWKHFIQQLKQLSETFIGPPITCFNIINFNTVYNRVKLEQPG